MFPVFANELNLCLLSSCLCAKAVRLRSGISGRLHITDDLRVVVFPKHLSERGVVLETNFVLFHLFSELLSSENIPAKRFLKYTVPQVI